MRKLWLLFLLLVLSGSIFWWYHQKDPQPSSAVAQAVPVRIAQVLQQDLPLYVQSLGTTEALQAVVVRPRISGELTRIVFEEGQYVEQGQTLAYLDDRELKAALAQAIAQKTYNEAQLQNARLDLARYGQLLRGQGATRQQYDTQRAQVAMFESQIAQNEASIEQARTQLSYAEIKAPLSGRLGVRNIDVGNIVQSSDTAGLVSLTQMNPMGMVFSIPQQDLPRLIRALQKGALPVSATLSDQTVLQGQTKILDNQVDLATGTIRLKAEFSNPDSLLWPGSYANIRLQIETLKNVLVLPAEAIQQGPNGAYVFVVKEDLTVEQRPVKTTATSEGKVVIESGLQAQDRVVISGAGRLVSGRKVSVQEDR